VIRRIVLRNTELSVSRLGFGTASLHHLFGRRQREVLLKTALDEGVCHFDTAPLYGEGLAEQEIGRVLCGDRASITLSTKIGFTPARLMGNNLSLLYLHKAWINFTRSPFQALASDRRLDAGSITKVFEESLKSLRTDYVDLLLVHEPVSGEEEQIHQLRSLLQRWKDDGKILYVGLAGNAATCLRISAENDGFYDVMQVEDSHDHNPIVSNIFPQISYGYFRDIVEGRVELEARMQKALSSNQQGMLLFSTRSVLNLKNLINVYRELETT
jgi:aryl-alcohol dehydrogenase-like predicted oxidoreductase